MRSTWQIRPQTRSPTQIYSLFELNHQRAAATSWRHAGAAKVSVPAAVEFLFFSKCHAGAQARWQLIEMRWVDAAGGSGPAAAISEKQENVQNSRSVSSTDMQSAHAQRRSRRSRRCLLHSYYSISTTVYLLVDFIGLNFII